MNLGLLFLDLFNAVMNPWRWWWRNGSRLWRQWWFNLWIWWKWLLNLSGQNEGSEIPHERWMSTEPYCMTFNGCDRSNSADKNDTRLSPSMDEKGKVCAMRTTVLHLSPGRVSIRVQSPSSILHWCRHLPLSPFLWALSSLFPNNCIYSTKTPNSLPAGSEFGNRLDSLVSEWTLYWSMTPRSLPLTSPPTASLTFGRLTAGWVSEWGAWASQGTTGSPRPWRHRQRRSVSAEGRRGRKHRWRWRARTGLLGWVPPAAAPTRSVLFPLPSVCGPDSSGPDHHQRGPLPTVNGILP